MSSPGPDRTVTWEPTPPARTPAAAPTFPTPLGDDLLLVDELGRGGMSVVYLARDLRLDREVAVKVLLGSEAPGDVDPALLEARATARLSHPGVVTVHRVGTHEGRAFLVLERLHGETVAELAAARPLPTPLVLDLACQAAAALRHCHAHGVAHGDVSPRNLWVTPDGRVKLLDLGLATLSGAGAGHAAGTPGYAPPERGSPYADPHAGDVYGLAAVLHRLLHGAPPGASPPTRLDLPAGLADLLRRALDPDPRARPDAAALVAGLEAALRAARAGDASPYRYLDAFEAEHAALFFGRAPDLARLDTLRRRAAVVLLVGPSGAGKSSLLRAGLLPRLGAHARLVRVGDAVPDDADVVLLDALEEVFTLGEPDRTARSSAAFDLAARLHAHLGRGGRVVAAVREEYLARAVTLLGGDSPERLALMVLLPPTRDALREAVQGPARAMGYTVDPALVDELLLQVADEPAPLPLLQLACSRVWERRDSDAGRIGVEALHGLGGVSGLLAAHADEVVGALAEDGDAGRVDRILTLLLTAEGTRRPRARAALVDPADPRGSERVLDHLVAGRLLTARSGPAGPQVELAHEALIRRWGRLVRLLDEGARERRTAERVAAAQAHWQARDHSPDLLWRGAALAEAEAVVASHPELLPGEARRFVHESARRARLRRRLQGSGIAAVLVVALALAVGGQVGLREFRAQATAAAAEARRAEDARRAAESRALALEAEQALSRDHRRALELGLQAWETAPDRMAGEVLRAALATPWLTASLAGNTGLVHDAAWSPDGTRVAAAGADGSVHVWRADGTLLGTAREAGVAVLGLAWAPDGRSFVTRHGDGALRRWGPDGDARGIVARVPPHALSLAFAPDGASLVVGGGDGAVRWIDLASGEERAVTRLGEGQVLRVTWTTEGLAAALDGGTVHTWQPGDPRPRRSFRAAGPGPLDVAALAGGRLATVGGPDSRLALWDHDGRRLAELPSHSAGIAAVLAAPDGDGFATLGRDGVARLWRADGTAGPVLPDHGGRVTDVAASPDGQAIATADDSSSVFVWARDGELLARLTGHVGWVPRVQWAPDGLRLLSAGQDGSVRVWTLDDATTARLADARTEAGRPESEATGLPDHPDHLHLRTRSGRGLGVSTMAEAPVQDLLALADGTVVARSGDRVLRAWREDGSLGATWTGHTGAIVAVATDGETVLTGAGDGTARRWRQGSAMEVGRLDVGGVVEAVAFGGEPGVALVGGSDGLWRWPAAGEAVRIALDPVTTLVGAGDGWAAGGPDGVVSRWHPAGALRWRSEPLPGPVEQLTPLAGGAWLVRSDAGAAVVDADGRTLARLTLAGGTAFAVAAPDGAALLLADDQGASQLVGADGATLVSLPPRAGAVTDAAWLPDGSAVFVASIDGAVRRVDRRTGAETLIDNLLPAFPAAVAVSGDGALLAAADTTGVVRMWQTDGTPVGRVADHRQLLVALAFSRDGRHLLSWSDDAAVRRDLVRLDDVAAAARARLAAMPLVEVQRGEPGKYGNLR